MEMKIDTDLGGFYRFPRKYTIECPESWKLGYTIWYWLIESKVFEWFNENRLYDYFAEQRFDNLDE